MPLRRPTSTLFPYTTLFRSLRPLRCPRGEVVGPFAHRVKLGLEGSPRAERTGVSDAILYPVQDCIGMQDRKSTRLNSSHRCISYAVFCLKKKTDSAASDMHA